MTVRHLPGALAARREIERRRDDLERIYYDDAMREQRAKWDESERSRRRLALWMGIAVGLGLVTVGRIVWAIAEMGT